MSENQYNFDSSDSDEERKKLEGSASTVTN